MPVKDPKNVREKLLNRDGDLCFYCGNPLLGDATIEHLVGMWVGGSHNKLDNLVLAHMKCNSKAGILPVKDKHALAKAIREGNHEERERLLQIARKLPDEVRTKAIKKQLAKQKAQDRELRKTLDYYTKLSMKDKK